MLQLDHDRYMMLGEKRAEEVLPQSEQAGDEGMGSGQGLLIGLT
jgi:hypothetical protein